MNGSIVSAAAPRTLIADDQPDVLAALRLLLKAEGYQTETVTSPAAVIAALEARDFDVVLMDLNYARDTTSGHEGLDLLARIQELDSAVPVVVMTAWGTIDIAIEAMRRGVRDFIQKPWENAHLLAVLRAQVTARREQREREGRARRQEQELAEAREIQECLLPKTVPQVTGYEIAHAWRPARVVSGDYFDVLKFNEARLGCCIADVVGKGMPAALLMSNVQAAVKAFASEAVMPAELCQKVNRVVCGNIAANKYITFFYACLDAAARRLTYANAGHNPPLLIRPDGTMAELAEGGTVLGAFPEWVYTQETIDLGPGDRVVLFTDGVTEIRSPEGEEFGEARLYELLRANRGRSAAALQALVMEAIGDFSGGDFGDDATLIVIAVENTNEADRDR